MLSDLFSGLDAGQDCQIGPGPAPGDRIAVEQPQLAAIAEQFGVDWQPGSRPARTIIERKGRLVGRVEVLSLLRRALADAGAGGDFDVVLSSIKPLLVSAEFVGSPRVDSIDYDRDSGLFSANLVFEANGAEPFQMPIRGVAREMSSIPVTSRIIEEGSVLTPSDFDNRRVGRSLARGDLLLQARDGVGLALRHRLMAGVPVPLSELIRPNLIKRGNSVLVELRGSGLTLTTKGEAIDNGAVGEWVHVLNPASRMIVVARVIGAGLAQVDANSEPIGVAPGQDGLPTSYSVGNLSQSPIRPALYR